MPSLQALRRKVASVKNTQKVTKAMKMVASSKLRRAQQRILAFRPYGQRMRRVLADLSLRVNRGLHPLLQKRQVKTIQVSVVTSDRGLCGAFNTNIIRKAVEVIGECEVRGAKVTVGLVGRKGKEYFGRRHWPIREEYINVFHLLTYEHAMDIAQAGGQAFIDGVFDEVYVVYNEYKSVMQQRVIVEKLLPIESFDDTGQPQASMVGGYLYEPSEDLLLTALLPKHAQAQVYRVLLESWAAEQAARMAAMDGATRNAGELIKKLTLQYNKTRQGAITKELMDIVGGAEALG